MRENKYEDSKRLVRLGETEMLIPSRDDPIVLEVEQEVVESVPITMMDIFLDAVSYRVEIPVTKMRYFRSMGSGYPLCPRCEMTIEREYMHYCDRCGQKLGWDSWEDAEIVLGDRV